MLSAPLPLLVHYASVEDGVRVIISSEEPNAADRRELGRLNADSVDEVEDLLTRVALNLFGSDRHECISSPIRIYGDPYHLGPHEWFIDYNPQEKEVNGLRISVIQRPTSIETPKD